MNEWMDGCLEYRSPCSPGGPRGPAGPGIGSESGSAEIMQMLRRFPVSDVSEQIVIWKIDFIVKSLTEDEIRI